MPESRPLIALEWETLSAGNLLDNACKWARTRVKLTGSKEGEQVVIAVDDDADMDGMAHSLAAAYPDTDKDQGILVTQLPRPCYFGMEEPLGAAPQKARAFIPIYPNTLPTAPKPPRAARTAS